MLALGTATYLEPLLPGLDPSLVAVAVIGSLTVLPALLSRLGDKVERARIPLLGRRRVGEGRIWGAIVDRVLRRHPALTLVVPHLGADEFVNRPPVPVLRPLVSLAVLGFLVALYQGFFFAEQTSPSEALRLISRHKVSLTNSLPAISAAIPVALCGSTT